MEDADELLLEFGEVQILSLKATHLPIVKASFDGSVRKCFFVFYQSIVTQVLRHDETTEKFVQISAVKVRAVDPFLVALDGRPVDSSKGSCSDAVI